MRGIALLVLGLLSLAVAPVPRSSGADATKTTNVVTSFDGTPLYSTLFLPPGASATSPVPIVLRSHGWGGHGEREVVPGSMLERLLAAGYAVLTWDARGFGYSGGIVHLDQPAFEGRDVSALLDWVVAHRPEITLEAPGDPLVGWTGQSYGGAIQLATAIFDPRIDAIAPEITWYDLRYSLYSGQVVNLAWGQYFYAVGAGAAELEGLDPRNPAGPQAGGLHPALRRAEVEGVTTNRLSQATLDFFAGSSLAGYRAERPLRVPTLVMQGSVDTLFDLNEGSAIFQHVRAAGIPAKLVVFCGGHVLCPASYAAVDDRAHLDEVILAWLARYLRGHDVGTGAAVEYRTNEGIWRAADNFPPSAAVLRTASGAGRLLVTPLPTSGLTASGRPATTASPSLPGDPHALTFEVAHASQGPLELVGIPSARLRVTGIGPTAHLFLKLVDREAGEVVNLQETPLLVSSLGEVPRTFALDLAGIAYTLPAGHHLDLQVATTSLMHANARSLGAVEVEVEVAVPAQERT
ncbi:MAG: alpha/beta hydrolase [Actinomycetota bacterium]|nr:alpha/beta hydrolase [Actinomycetota bacterium]